MNVIARRNSFNRILVDLNTQCDLLLPRGALPVTNRSEILPNIRKLMNWGRIEAHPIISTLEAHRPGESIRGLPSYCIDRTPGQRKLPFTLLPRRIVCHGDNTLDLPVDVFRRYQQVIFTKRNRDFLTNPKADRIVNLISSDHLVVFGAVAEHCVKAAVLGLLARQHRIAVVTDACGFWSAGDAELAMRQMDAKGAVLVTTEELIFGAAEERIKASRPMIFAEAAEDETTVLAGSRSNGNGCSHGNGKSNGNGKSTGNGRLAPDWTVPVQDSEAAALPDHSPADRLPPVLRPGRKGVTPPHTKDSAGLA
jgi:nicotinamidase-related amidase